MGREKDHHKERVNASSVMARDCGPPSWVVRKVRRLAAHHLGGPQLRAVTRENSVRKIGLPRPSLFVFPNNPNLLSQHSLPPLPIELQSGELGHKLAGLVPMRIVEIRMRLHHFDIATATSGRRN